MSDMDISAEWFLRVLNQNLQNPEWAAQYWEHRYKLEREEHEETRRQLAEAERGLRDVGKAIVESIQAT